MTVTVSLWPQHPERTWSHVMSEAKQGQACLVLGWRTITMRDTQEEEQDPVTPPPNKLSEFKYQKIVPRMLLSRFLKLFYSVSWIFYICKSCLLDLIVKLNLYKHEIIYLLNNACKTNGGTYHLSDCKPSRHTDKWHIWLNILVSSVNVH